MLLRAIIDSIESVAPRSAQEQWDNSGMQIGDTGREINSVLLTTDVTTEVVNEAIERGCQLIISHHPLLFHGLKQICGETAQQRIVETAIRHQIAIYSAHTSLDSVMGGINTRLADKLGIKNYHILVPSSDEKTGLGVIGPLLFVRALYPRAERDDRTRGAMRRKRSRVYSGSYPTRSRCLYHGRLQVS